MLCDRYMHGTDWEESQSQNILVDRFIWELVSVINLQHNCFCLVGETNASKTFILSMLS